MRRSLSSGAEIRLMLPEECRAVAQLFHAVWHETQAPLQDPRKAAERGPAFFQARVAQRAERTVVAIRDGIIIGFACFTPPRLDSLFVAKGSRGSGAGDALCAAAEAAIRASGATSMELDCLKGNETARQFYELRGWRVSGESDSIDEHPDGPIVVKHWHMVK